VRILVWPFAIALALMLGVLALFSLVVLVVGPAHRGAAQVSLPTDLDLGWVAAEGKGGYQTIAYSVPPITARRIISDPGIFSPLVLTNNGRQVVVTGHVTCVKGDDYEIQTTATQSTTGALARGRVEGRCSDRTDKFEAPTWVYDEALFEPGPAQVCGLLVTRNRGKVSDVFQWCRKENVDLRPTNAS
jgi:hypothetical protein